ncbi:MAG: metalloregulator ArsR/SmtB family transcription factor [Gammaproteobacteria bacterium]|nr:metalloregulator ArsR/SmtB family transcription factor [Gammaproteobacteria bacterium]
MNSLLTALRAAGEATRLRILAVLRNSELTVSELVEVLDQSQPRVSRHLKLLCDSGLLERYQEGARVFHRIADNGSMAHISRALLEMLDIPDQELQRDQARLSNIKSRNAALAAAYFRKNALEWDSIRTRMVDDMDIEQRLISFIKEKKTGLLLDLGTGTGRMLEIFSPYIERGIGIDTSREMLTVARSNLDSAGVKNCTVGQHDIRQLHFSDETIDSVMIHQVLHYLDSPEEVVHEAVRVLKPQGQLVVVDFLPHDLEFLREKHAHRRLGITVQSLQQWCGPEVCQLVHAEQLSANEKDDPGSLTVGLWNFEKK